MNAKSATALTVGAVALIAVTSFTTLWISGRAAAPLPKAAVVDTQPVYPKSLQGTKSLELGELILLLIPDTPADQFGWDYRVNSPITWLTNGVEYGGMSATRRGVVRVNIGGKKATVLRQKTEELGWSVIYKTDGNPNFGPAEIEIKPGGVAPEDICFGTNFDGCAFDAPLPSLSAAGIVATPICEKTSLGEEYKAFLLKHLDRRPTVMVMVTGGGSGGVSSSITLKLRDVPLDTRQCISPYANK